MKYYIYISDAKVDMLFPQVPHDIKKKVALEFKMDLKLLSASRKTETESEDNRIARLETVVDFIREYGDIGTADRPGEYIEDTLSMRWGYYGFQRDDNPVVYFGGETERTILGLGGSTKHLIGNAGTSSAHSHSATPFLLDFLSKELGLHSENPDLEWARQHGQDFSPITAVELATTQMRGPEQRIDFVAKRLAYGPVERFNDNPLLKDKHVLLATPLYVAMAD
ncbi:DUF7019 family protein [Acidicapsa acidisoli]|uniref:DUF7019 family protein n=1 Tax=Acidicapsa acidisoli TaxID=1615681 RepID=UPI0021DFF96E|nr:SAVMC3_10250 family protein [Acidicapsa acidisoli]